MKKKLLALAGFGLGLSAAHAQTVTTPPRSITAQQETPGVDSTFQGNVMPNPQTSTIVLNTGAAAPAPAPTPAPAPPPTPPPAPTKKFGGCMVTSPNGPDVSIVLFSITTNRIEQADFDSSPTLTPAQQAEVQPGGACPSNVLIWYGHNYVGADALAAGYASSDYLSTWLTYPDPAYPNGPAW